MKTQAYYFWMLLVCLLASSAARSARSFATIPRGGATSRTPNHRSRNGKRSFLGWWRERRDAAKESFINFTEQRTFFSRELMPQSDQDAEWAAFLKGWLLCALPLPLPLLFAALAADSALLRSSLWDDPIKRKYTIGLFHGVLVFSVLLKEMSEMETFNRPRNILILLNIATNLFLGKTGRYKATKRLMDTAIFGTLFYILYHHFQTPLLGDVPGRRWYK